MADATAEKPPVKEALRRAPAAAEGSVAAARGRPQTDVAAAPDGRGGLGRPSGWRKLTGLL